MRNFSPQIFHSDYFSGWDVDELQTVLDNSSRAQSHRPIPGAIEPSA